MARQEVNAAIAELLGFVAADQFFKPTLIGVEQEVFLLDYHGRPAIIAQQIARETDQVEAGGFVLERATPAIPLDGGAIRTIAQDLERWLAITQISALKHNAFVHLAGHIGGSTPIRIRDFRLREIAASVPDISAAARCASFQINLSTTPARFDDDYQFACAIAAPLVAMHSPNGDPRIDQLVTALGSERMGFPAEWPHDVISAFDEIASRPLIAHSAASDGLGLLDGLSKNLWRWVRPRLLKMGNQASLRLEFRPLRAGWHLDEEIAATAIFVGLMRSSRRYYPWAEITPAEAAKNVIAAGRDGANAIFSYGAGREAVRAREIFGQMLEVADRGLADLDVPTGDRDRYLAILDHRLRVPGEFQ